MSDFFSKIKSFFVESEKKPFNRFCSDYLKIKGELAVSDVHVSGQELNFKVSWRGSTVPFWVSSKYQVSDIVSIIAAGLAFGLNLVEISQELKNYGIDS